MKTTPLFTSFLTFQANNRHSCSKKRGYFAAWSELIRNQTKWRYAEWSKCCRSAEFIIQLARAAFITSFIFITMFPYKSSLLLVKWRLLNWGNIWDWGAEVEIESSRNEQQVQVMLLQGIIYYINWQRIFSRRRLTIITRLRSTGQLIRFSKFILVFYSASNALYKFYFQF